MAIICTIFRVRSMFGIPIDCKFSVDYKKLNISKIYYMKFCDKCVQRKCGIDGPE